MYYNACFAVYGFKIMCKIAKGAFEIPHKILNPYMYTAKYALYYWNVPTCHWYHSYTASYSLL